MPIAATAEIPISIRVHGGWSLLSGGDVNPGTQAFFDWGKAYFFPAGAVSVTGGYERVGWGNEYGADVVFELGRNIGLGLGGGYLRVPKKNLRPMMRVSSDGVPLYPYSFGAGTELSAVPLKLSVFVTVPISHRSSFVGHAGLSGYLAARYEAEWVVSEEAPYLDSRWQVFSTRTRKAHLPLGVHAGIAFEHNLTRTIAFFVEAQGAYARFRGLEGTTVCSEGPFGGLFAPFEESGKLYYESIPAVPGAPRLIMVQNSPQAGPGRSPRVAIVDFSRISLQAGIKIRL